MPNHMPLSSALHSGPLIWALLDNGLKFEALFQRPIRIMDMGDMGPDIGPLSWALHDSGPQIWDLRIMGRPNIDANGPKCVLAQRPKYGPLRIMVLRSGLSPIREATKI